MILGIDFGASTTDAVLFDRKKILKKASSERALGPARELNSFLKRKGFTPREVKQVAITGGKSSFFKSRVLGLKPKHVGEIDAIGFGGAFLAGLKRCLVVSMGTGTCIVSFEGGKARHAAGTSLGGGTIVGLSKSLFGEANPEKLMELASKGSLKKVDLSVEEIVGGGIGIVPGRASASNFAKTGKASRADLALAVQNMVAESNAVIAALAARSSKQKKLVFVGKTAAYPAIKASVKSVLGYYGFRPDFPKVGKFATAAGAACHPSNKV
jgi:type II pantothenate kinase